MSPNHCIEDDRPMTPVPYLRLITGPRLSEPQRVRFEWGLALQGKPNSVPAFCDTESPGPRLSELMPLAFRHPHPGGMADNSPTFQRWDHDNREPSPAGTADESLSPAQSLPVHCSKEAWVAEMKRLIDEGKNLKLALAVTAAKADLAYGDWTAIWKSEDRPFAKGKADKLFFIGRNLGVLNAPDRERLPLSLSALYVVAHLALDIVRTHLADRRIHRKMKVDEAEALLAEYKPRSEATPVAVRLPRWLSRIHRLFDLIADATPSIRQAAMREVQARMDCFANAATSLSTEA